MELAGTGACNYRDLPPWKPAKFRSIAGSKGNKFLDILNGYQTVRATKGAYVRERPSGRLAWVDLCGNADICAYTIDDKSITVGSLSIDAELTFSCSSRRRNYYAGRQLE